jgi:hypothetical protein
VLTARIADETVRDDELSLLERGVREWRRELLDDLGGPQAVTAAQRALVDTAIGSQILLQTVDRYLFDLASRNGVVNKRSRRVFQVVGDRMRIAEGLVRQLQALGLERRPRKGRDLSQYVSERYGAPAPEHPNDNATTTEAE